MPVSPAGVAQVPNYWNVYGHSYFQNAFGTRTQAGRADGAFRNLLNVDHTSFANLSVTGSRLSVEGNGQGGYARLYQNVTGVHSPQFGDGSPYIATGGSYLLAWGINDLGFNGNTAQFNAAYGHAMRAVISRCRMSTLRENDYAGAAGTGTIAYGAGFTSANFGGTAAELCSGTSVHYATSLTNANLTITLPTDYAGETVVLAFICNAGVAGGIVTFSGTAGVTGTLTLSNIQPGAALTHSPVVQRIRNLTSANAGQTIIITVTSLDAGGAVQFDCFWLEAKNPPPVLVCNTSRLTSTGYSLYPGPPGDSDVATFNAVLPPIIAEFDGMVQMVDIDTALAKDAAKYSADGLHPNELGAGAMADAILAAVKRCPANQWGVADSTQPPSNRSSAVVLPSMFSRWYASQSLGGANGTAYTPVAGDVFALPFEITAGNARWVQWCVELISSTVATAVFSAIYDDRRYTGYPQQLYTYMANTAGTPLALSTGAGVKLSTTTPATNGYLSLAPDPGLYWIALKIVTAGTSSMRTMKGPSLFVPNLTAAGAGGTAPCGWLLAGQGASILPGTFPVGAVQADNVPMVGLLTA